MKKILLSLLFFSNTCFAQITLNSGFRINTLFSDNISHISKNSSSSDFNNSILIFDKSNENALDNLKLTLDCNNWLQTQAINQKVTVGDLDVSGNQMTVEANFNCTSFPIARPDKWEDIVSKHANTTDANYVLRMDLAGITTTTGHYLTPPPSSCYDLSLNRTYHVALVYDGTILKLYRNGIIISQIAATGNLILNNYLTTIGDYAVFNPVGTNFFGYINEVRIWNVARTQAQLQTYMNTSLPSPTTQTGLLGYYIFDNLINKQGNPAWNGTLSGGATINNTNPNCTFLPDPGIIANAGNDTSYCSNTPISHVLQGNGNGTYSWSPAVYLNNPNIQNPTATINATTTFYLTVSGGGGLCSAIDSTTIYVNPLPVIQTLNDTAICQLAPLILTTNSNATTYQWSPANYVNNSGIANPAFIGATSQRMYVTGTTGPGCSSMDSVDVTVKPAPVIQTINDTTLCLNQNITLTTTGGLSYSWSPVTGLSNPGIANPVFSGNTGRTYTVTGIGINGCAGTDTVNISISSPAALKQPPSFSTCQKRAVQLDGNNGTRVSYLWSPATYLSNNTIINPVANPPQTTLYTLVVTDNSCGYDSTFTTQVTVLPSPIVSAGKSNDIDCTIHSATLNATGGNQYTWSPSTGLNSTTISYPVASPATTQKYIVLVTDASGCTNTDSVTVFVNTGANIGKFMPNSFTPNGDGLNDCYGLKNWGQIQQLQFYIFNRYGEQVFATANPGKCWDGTYKGKRALAGTYVYVIKATTDCGTEEHKGNFLLIR
jgi:gliding motility-associated-like protein